MEKLIELLNEFNEGGHWRDENFDANKLLVISKEYGFIERLVKNEKIKLGAYDVEGYHFNVHIYLDLIMLLSIKDNPIEYLCSILKEE